MAGTSYTRQSIFVDGDTITASLFNDEYNQLLNAFSYNSTGTTGHQHDGTSGQGGNIYIIGDQDFLNKIEADSTNNRWGFYVEVAAAAVEQIRIQDGAIVPVTDNDIDLGTSSLEFKNLYIDGTATVDTLVVDEATTVGTTLSVTGATTLSSTLDVTGVATFNGNVVLGDANTDTITVNADIDSNLIPSADSTYTLGNAFNYWSNAYVDEVTTTGDVSVGGNLVVTGNATISGTLTFGDADTDSITLNAEIASDVIPDLDGNYDLGSASKEWQDLYIDGTANIDNLVADAVDINSGTIDNTVIGGTTAVAGTFTTATATTGEITTVNSTDVNATTVDSTNVEVTNIKAKDGTSSASIADATGVMTIASSVLTTTDINGGTIDGTTIGNTTASTGNFSTLSIGGTAITATAAELNALDGITSTVTELNYTDGVTSNIQTQLDAKQGLDSDLSAIAGLANTDGNFIVGNGTTWVVESGDTAIASLGITATATELNYTDGVTSAIQTQLDSKAPIDAATFTGTTTIPTADINGGAIDGVTIGGASAGAGTFTNLTANTNLTINATTTVDGVIDDDTLATASATKLATSESIKAYVDAQVGSVDTLSEVLGNGNTSGASDIIISSGQSLTADTISETTVDAGVTIDSVLLKDDGVNATNIEITNLKANDGTAAGSIADTTGAVTLNSFISNSVDIGGGSIDGAAVGASSASTGAFTTLTASTSLNIAASTTIDGVLDEDTLVSDSATKLATQQSIKAYVDSKPGVTDGDKGDVVVSSSGSVWTVESAAGNFNVTNDLTVDTNTLYVDSTNNRVGIGTTSPSSLLHLASTGSAILTLEADTDNVTETDNARIEMSQDGGSVSGYMGFDTGENGISVWNSSAYYVRFGTGNTERMRIDSSGNVGIGISVPTSILHVRPVDETNFRVFEESTNLILASETNSGRDSNRGMDLESSTLRAVISGTPRLTVNSSGIDVAGYVNVDSTLKLQESSHRTGLLELDYSGTAGFEGLSINHSGYIVNFMASENQYGFYDDTNNEWGVKGTANGTVELFYDGSTKLQTASNGITVTDTITVNNVLPSADNTGVVGNSTYTYSNGEFTNFTVNSVLNVRQAIDLADNDILRFGSSDDAEFLCNGSDFLLDLNSGIGDFIIRDGTTERFRFEDAGNLLIGKTTGDVTTEGLEFNNNGTITVVSTSSLPMYVRRNGTDGTMVAFYNDGSLAGYISVSGTEVSYVGGHLARWTHVDSDNGSLLKGTVMTNLDEMCVWKQAIFTTQKVISPAVEAIDAVDEIPEERDDEGNIIQEYVPAVEPREAQEAVYQDVVRAELYYGDAVEGDTVDFEYEGQIYSATIQYEENEQLNKNAVSSVEGDPNVSGVFVNYDEDGDIVLGMTGDLVIRIAQGTTVARGDLLMSAGDGTAKPQGDDIVRSKTIAKVTSTSVTETYNDGSYLVPCVLMAC